MRLMTLLFLALSACSDDERAATAAAPTTAAAPPNVDHEGPPEADPYAAFPRFGAVTGVQLRVHQQPSDQSPVVGWLRIGAVVRLGGERRPGPGCGSSYVAIHPRGYVCAEADAMVVRDAPIPLEAPTESGWHDAPSQTEVAADRGALVLPPVVRDAPLPYDYYYVKEPTVPEYHRLPSRNEQRAALAKAARFQTLLADNEDRAWRYLRGESEDGPSGTVVAHRYLQHGFYVAATGEELRARRRFIRTTQGRYIKQSQLEARTGSEFRGVALDDTTTLPVAWTTRTSRLQMRERGEDGESRWRDDESGEPLERQTRLPGWKDRRNIDGRVMHEIETPEGMRYLRHFRASVARRQARPEEVGDDEPWIHIDLSEQTLVMYRGDDPLYATLVSSGVEEHATPTGLFTIRRKLMTDTMSNLGDGAEDSYRIEDVPYTQYFEGSFALHTAFWHTRFGLPRSHGCVNLAPMDAHWIFQRTWPELPENWHGASTDQTSLRGSHVLVTD